mmetsp:Transcript_21358/g.59192  ORF Transcript_21358/g.59192 Transcript_21358/m.59192 type:complete len:365 (-) Transcript_21358:1390-2484(-)
MRLTNPLRLLMLLLNLDRIAAAAVAAASSDTGSRTTPSAAAATTTTRWSSRRLPHRRRRLDLRDDNDDHHHPLQGSSHLLWDADDSTLPKASNTGQPFSSPISSLLQLQSSKSPRATASPFQSSSSSSWLVVNRQKSRQRGPTIDETIDASSVLSIEEEELEPSTTPSPLQSPQQQQPPLIDKAAAAEYQQLGRAGKLVAGVTELALVVALDYATGFVSGYALGSVVGWVPPLVRQRFPNRFPPPTTTTTVVAARSSKLAAWHRRSVGWGTTLGSLQAVVSGSNVGARLVRGGKDDEYTNLLSSMMLGAYWSRAEGPAGMIKGALVYGGIVFVLSGGGKRTERQERYDDNTNTVAPMVVPPTAT